ncbi:MAG: hypothetical protein SOY28_04720, partial [Roseburia sp.]|nr:hypothetical protein [Roseburia sp.]
GLGSSAGVAARGGVNGWDPRKRGGRDSTGRCVPVRSPLTIRRSKGLSTTKSEKNHNPPIAITAVWGLDIS